VVEFQPEKLEFQPEELEFQPEEHEIKPEELQFQPEEHQFQPEQCQFHVNFSRRNITILKPKNNSTSACEPRNNDANDIASTFDPFEPSSPPLNHGVQRSALEG
jgi:hypothetical protein